MVLTVADLVQEKHLLIDLDPLQPISKRCPPREEQLPNESRRMWEAVSEAIHAKDYSKATQIKQEIEELQRQKAAARIEEKKPFRPRFFENMNDRVGQPHLTKKEKEALEKLDKGEYKLEECKI